MEHHLAVAAERMPPPPPPRWTSSLPFADQHPLEANASVFGGLSALREAAFGQDERPSLLPPPPSTSSPYQQQQTLGQSSLGQSSTSPLYYARDASNASTASSSSSSASLASSLRTADPPFYFAPFPSLPPPGQTRAPLFDADKRAFSPETDGRQFSPAAASFLAKPPGLPRRSPIRASLVPERNNSAPMDVSGGNKRVSDEERKAKHREAQRRFVRRKKIAMQQLRELATAMEKQLEFLHATSERQRLEADNAMIQSQLEAAAANGEVKPETNPADGESDSNERREGLKVAQHPGWEYREFAW